MLDTLSPQSSVLSTHMSDTDPLILVGPQRSGTTALAAALVFARFPFRTRLLPRSAFRRPRRVVLAVWHPG